MNLRKGTCAYLEVIDLDVSVEGGGEESRAVVVEGEAGDGLGVVAHAMQLLEPAHHVPHLDAVPACHGRSRHW